MISIKKISNKVSFLAIRLIIFFVFSTIQIIAQERNLKGHEFTVLCIDIDKTGKYLVSGSYDTDVILWDNHEGELLKTFTTVSQTANDSIQIRQAAFDYLEGWYYKDANRVDNAVHFEFVKRSIHTHDGTAFLGTINKSRMDYITLYHRDREYQLATKVIILDATPTIASVKVVFNECIEYLYIAKINNHWQLVNNLFTGNPDYKTN